MNKAEIKEACYFIKTLLDEKEMPVKQWFRFDKRLRKWWEKYGDGEIDLIVRNKS